jgi:hypothetical protein
MNKETNTELGNNPKPQLYNLKSDPGEKTNLSDRYPEKVLDLKNKLEKIKASKK